MVDTMVKNVYFSLILLNNVFSCVIIVYSSDNRDNEVRLKGLQNEKGINTIYIISFIHNC